VARTLGAYRKLLAGEMTAADVLKEASVHERYGVTTLRLPQVVSQRERSDR
jgi:hypothetical protein